MVRGVEPFVHQDSTGHVQLCRFRQGRVRDRTRSHQDGVGRDRFPLDDHTGDPVGARDRRSGRTRAQLHPASGVQIGEVGPELGTQGGLQRGVGRLQHGHLGAGLPGGSGHFQADPAGADHHEAPALAEGGLDRLGITDPAQGVHTRQVHPLDRQPSRTRSGGQHQVGVAHLSAGGEACGAVVRIDTGDGVAQHGLHATAGVVAGFVRIHRAHRILTEQHPLGQGGTFVGSLTLVSDQQHRTVVAQIAKLIDQRGGRQPGTDDQQVSMGHDLLLGISAPPAARRPASGRERVLPL